MNVKKFKEDIHQNKPSSKSPNFNVFWVYNHNVVQIKLERVQHFHFLCAIFFKSQNMENFVKVSKPQYWKK